MLTLGDDKKPPSKAKAVVGSVVFYTLITLYALTAPVICTIPAGFAMAFLVAMPVAFFYHLMPWAGWLIIALSFMALTAGFGAAGWYYVKFSSLMGGTRRGKVSWMLAIGSVPIWSFVAYIAIVSIFTSGSTFGSVIGSSIVPLSIILGLVAQFYAALVINGKVTAPTMLNQFTNNLSKAPKTPKTSATAIGAAHPELLTSRLAAMKETTDLEQLNVIALDCLNNCGLSVSANELKTGASEPVPLLLNVLVKQKRHDDAEEISKHFLHVIEHHSN